ncbi:MAG TPA: hypothetical protein P5060_01720 [Candidatus Absconditabacterales bacterium]|nr:hypothetical protein [Candidatus Absconditabacterales bacterium]
MKLFFVAEDSLYKIFKTLEKIPKGKHIEISIDSHHSLFDNEWWGKQIKDVLDKRFINATFVTKTEKSRKFFEKIGLDTKHLEKNKIIKVFRIIYLFVFNIKKFHLSTLNDKKKYSFFLIFGFEVLFVLGILYLLYSLILPSAKIYIHPAKNIETIIYNFRYYPNTDLDYPRYSRFISIPFFTGSLDYKYDMSMNTINSKYLQNPSAGRIKIYNTTEKEYAFVPNTRFITEDGRLFKTTNWIEIPAGYEGVPGEKIVTVQAMEKDDNGILMGKRGNIENGTKLYVKNLKQSLFLKELYAIAMEDFEGGDLQSMGTISDEDISLLSGKLYSYLDQQKKNIVIQNFDVEDGVLLAFDDTIGLQVKNINIPHFSGEESAILNGSVEADMLFVYVKWQDIIDAFSNYIQQRPSDKTHLVSIDKNSLVFFDEDEIKVEDGTFIIPTKIDIIQGYNFEKDINAIIEDVKTHIVGGEREESREYILSFPEISSVKIKITPIWYDTISKLKSRIKIIVDNN